MKKLKPPLAEKPARTPWYRLISLIILPAARTTICIGSGTTRAFNTLPVGDSFTDHPMEPGYEERKEKYVQLLHILEM